MSCSVTSAIEQELVDEKDRMAAILNNTVDAIITIATDGTVQSFNGAAERMWGYKSSEVRPRGRSRGRCGGRSRERSRGHRRRKIALRSRHK